MEFSQAIRNLVHFADQIKELDREIVRIEVESKRLLSDSIENGLIYFEKAKVIHEDLEKIRKLRIEAEEAGKKVKEAKEWLYEQLSPFEGNRIVYDYVPEKGQRRTCQVFLEEEEVKFI
jgi:regulator of RNase E activity RraB